MNRLWICRCAVLGALAVFAAASAARAAEPEVVSVETRTYDVFVDDKNSGQSTLVITRYNDGTEKVSADAKVTVRWTVFTYGYEFHGQEQWRGGRLESLTSRAVDGGKKLSLTVMRADRGYSITKGEGKPTIAPEVQLTTNYWRQPSGEAAGRAISVLDADNGKVYEVKLESLGPKELTVAGQRVAATGYSLKGKLDVDLWFDAQGLLVYQDGTEDGHPTELRLVSIQRPEVPRPAVPRPGKER